MQKKIGLSIWEIQKRYGDKRAIEIAADIGADCVDIFTAAPELSCALPDSVYGKGDDAVIEYFSSLKETAASLGIEINQTHGRLIGVVGDEEKDKITLENGRLDLLAASVLGAKACVMHTVSTLRVGLGVSPERMRELDFHQFSSLLPYAKKYNVKLASETLGDAPGFDCINFFGRLDEYLSSRERLINCEGGEYFSYCMDTGHTNKGVRYGEPEVGTFIRALGNNISVLHLNDNNGLTDQHKPPMCGTIDWKDTLNALDEIGYDGVYNMEINLSCFGKGFEKETAEFSIKLMRNMLVDR